MLEVECMEMETSDDRSIQACKMTFDLSIIDDEMIYVINEKINCLMKRHMFANDDNITIKYQFRLEY